MSKLDDFVTEQQFTDDTVKRTKQILEIVVGGIDAEKIRRAVSGEATEAEMAEVCAGMFAGQAAIFQSLHTNVMALGKHGLIDQKTAAQVTAAIKVLSNAVMASIVSLHGKRGDGKTAEIIPFPGSGSQRVH